ncbi:protein shifted-like isoform X2 [Lineus longissimus]|uniref:protein shifted-like isoform X2 n=1 Tax=Lineus longissimus TaxID=88925 RepID=UPI00315D3905
MEHNSILAWTLTFSLCGLTCSYVSEQRLSMWIDENVIEEFFDIPMDIYIIQDGQVIPFLKNPKFFDQLPPIPARVERIRLTWQAGRSTYWYYFAELLSMDTMMLYDPLLSIPVSGLISGEQASFEVAIPCTGRKKGIASLHIKLHITDAWAKPIDGSPLQLRMRKECAVHGNLVKKESLYLSCDSKCENGGRCNEHGDCECRQGYHGSFCELALCEPRCMNNGQCISPGVCACPDGYTGNTCEIARFTCRPTCLNNGVCIGYNQCKCQDGYIGHTCHIPVCRKICGPHGRCVEADLCHCDFGWHGNDCTKRHKSQASRIRRKLRRMKRERRKQKREQEAALAAAKKKD